MVSREDIEKTEENGRIDLTDEDLDQLQTDFEDILDSFAALDDIDTEGVEPSHHPIDHDDRTRADEREECLPREEALSNTENTEDGYFKGPRSVE